MESVKAILSSARNPGRSDVVTKNIPNMPTWNEKHLRAAKRAAGIALWSWNVDTDAITMDEHHMTFGMFRKTNRKSLSKFYRGIFTPLILSGSGQHSRLRAL